MTTECTPQCFHKKKPVSKFNAELHTAPGVPSPAEEHAELNLPGIFFAFGTCSVHRLLRQGLETSPCIRLHLFLAHMS